MKNYKTAYYLTYKQTQDLGGLIRKGEKGTQITYWATIKGKTAEIEAESTQKETPNHYQ